MPGRKAGGRPWIAHPVRGPLIAVVLAPVVALVVALGGLLVVVAVLSLVLTGLDPRNWLSPNAADRLWGTGVVGDAALFVQFMVSMALVGGGASAIRWGYYGSER